MFKGEWHSPLQDILSSIVYLIAKVCRNKEAGAKQQLFLVV